MKNDLADTVEALEKDKAFLEELEKGCSTKEAEWEERQKVRAEELLALADTIKLLNDDDALELFKKTLPTPSLLQIAVTSQEATRRVQQILKNSRRKDYRLDLISVALHG